MTVPESAGAPGFDRGSPEGGSDSVSAADPVPVTDSQRFFRVVRTRDTYGPALEALDGGGGI